MDWLFDHSLDPLIDWLIDGLIEQILRWLVDWLNFLLKFTFFLSQHGSHSSFQGLKFDYGPETGKILLSTKVVCVWRQRGEQTHRQVAAADDKDRLEHTFGGDWCLLLVIPRSKLRVDIPIKNQNGLGQTLTKHTRLITFLFWTGLVLHHRCAGRGERGNVGWKQDKSGITFLFTQTREKNTVCNRFLMCLLTCEEWAIHYSSGTLFLSPSAGVVPSCHPAPHFVSIEQLFPMYSFFKTADTRKTACLEWKTGNGSWRIAARSSSDGCCVA